VRTWRSSFQTTYEELKQAKATNICKGERELPDYLWGIETCSSRCNSQNCKLGFQTTYEELKLEVKAGVTVYVKGFQTTYEELKLSSALISTPSTALASRLPMRNWNRSSATNTSTWSGFQTTYEELKPPFLVAAMGFAGLASRLPMRNWNSTPRPSGN